MKHISTFIIIWLLSLMHLGCKQIESVDPISETRSSLDLFSQYGEVHNAMLSYIDNNIDINKTCCTEEEALDYLVELHSEYAEALTLPDSDKKLIKELLPSYKHLYNKENICFSPSTKTDYTNNDSEETIYVYTTEDIYNSINASFIEAK